MKIKPVGNKIIVKRIEEEAKTSSGLILTHGKEINGNAWGEIVSLPEVSDNLWIKTMKVGGKVLYKRFQADNAISLDNTDDRFEVVDIEPNDGSRQGQVLAYKE